MHYSYEHFCWEYYDALLFFYTHNPQLASYLPIGTKSYRNESFNWDIIEAPQTIPSSYLFLPASWRDRALPYQFTFESFTYKNTGSSVIRSSHSPSFLPPSLSASIPSSPKPISTPIIRAVHHFLSSYPPPKPLPCTPWPPTSLKYLSLPLSLSSISLLSASISLCCCSCIIYCCCCCCN